MELLNKLSTYNIFNYLFPGILFAALGEKVSDYKLIQHDLLIGIFLYYFYGLLISRFGSLLVEPFLKKICFLDFAEYKDFVSASAQDAKIEILSEVNNMYRSLIALFTCLAGLKLINFLQNTSDFLNKNMIEILIIVLLIVFLFSYRKQTKYITARIEKYTETE